MLLCLTVLGAMAQEKHTISGYIKSAASGEELIGATVYEPQTGSGASSNVYGFYSLTLPAGNYELQYQYLGHQSITVAINLKGDTTITTELPEDNKQLDVVEVTAEKTNKQIEDVSMSTIDLPVSTIKKIPAVFGEVDIIKTLQLLPGITSAGEGVGGFFVRGGGVDQNLILLDEATVYNPSHLLGFFSVFNPDAIKDVQVYKGGIPAEYGGRLSSLLDIRMKDGNVKKFSMSGGLGLISSRLTIEAPLIKDKMSFIVSGRRTYADLYLKLSKDEGLRKSTLYFYDLNAKYNWRINEKNRIYVSGYFGRDVFRFGDNFFNDWGNATATFRWNHLFSDKLFSNFTFIYSKFDYSLGVPEGEQALDWDASIRDFSFKPDFTYYISPNNTLKFGAVVTHHTFEPGGIKPLSDESFITEIVLDARHAIESAFYISDEHKFGSKVTVQYGLRYSLFNNVGPGKEYIYDENFDQPIDTQRYGNFEGINMYHGAEPRLAVRYAWNTKNALKLSYNRTMQYLHLISNSTVSSPLDIWVPSSKYIKPMTADQVALGWFRNFKDDMFEFSVEGYYKYMQNQLDYIDNAELLLNDKMETQLLRGDAYSFGAEFLLRKQTGRLTGWISYTLSRTRREIPGINDGKQYPATHDRTHDVAVVLSFQINERWDISANWVFTTGIAVTFPAGRFQFQGQNAPIFTERNGYRLPNYHRLDIAANYYFKTKPNKRIKHSLNFSVYNAYYRKNTFSVTFREDDDNPGQTAAYKTFLFGIVPSVTYNFQF